MSLLNRIAISNGDKNRKIKANRAIMMMERQRVAHWNQSLEAEIRRKRLRMLAK